MPIDTNKGPGGVDSSYGRRTTLASRNFSTSEKYGDVFGSETEGATAGLPFVKNLSTGLAEANIGSDTFAALPVSSGNVNAKVNHRTGTLASLKTLVGGNGEVAVATDRDALVVYDGSVIGGRTYFAGHAAAAMMGVALVNDTAAAGGVRVPFLDNLSVAATYGDISLAPNGVITLPLNTRFVRIAGYCFKTVDATANAIHKVVLNYRATAGGADQELLTMNVEPKFEAAPIFFLGDMVSVGNSRYIRLSFDNSSIEEIFGGMIISVEAYL